MTYRDSRSVTRRDQRQKPFCDAVTAVTYHVPKSVPSRAAPARITTATAVTGPRKQRAWELADELAGTHTSPRSDSGSASNTPLR